MSWYPWSSSDAMIAFFKNQFDRFQIELPSDRCIDKICEYVVTYVAKNQYYPRENEAMSRYLEDPPKGLTEPEKHALIPEIEIHLKIDLRETITDVQLHLGLWSALLFCWSEDGENDVKWVQKIELGFDSSGWPSRASS